VNRKKLTSGAALVAVLLATVAAEAQVTRYVHFRQGNADSWGVLEGENVHHLSAAPFAGGTRTGQTVPVASVTLLPPATPSTAVIVNVNYTTGVTGQPRDHPTIITLPPRAFVGSGAPILRPVEAQNVVAEPTVAIVIGKTARNVTPEQAGAHILGVAPAIDVTAMDWRPAGSQWTRAKGTDSFKPIGPVVVSGVDYNNLTIVGKHNGTALQPIKTADMIFDFNELVSYISRYMTLNPGDVVLAGTAGQNFVVPIRAGETFEVEIAGVGTLRNPVQAAAPIAPTLPPPYRPEGAARQ
jgi:2-keto-4-pentenoate hydratase/2-oxohepta-3-ene-1,7-dioic acid hydratase in catechol pathway